MRTNCPIYRLAIDAQPAFAGLLINLSTGQKSTFSNESIKFYAMNLQLSISKFKRILVGLKQFHRRICIITLISSAIIMAIRLSYRIE